MSECIELWHVATHSTNPDILCQFNLTDCNYSNGSITESTGCHQIDAFFWRIKVATKSHYPSFSRIFFSILIASISMIKTHRISTATYYCRVLLGTLHNAGSGDQVTTKERHTCPTAPPRSSVTTSAIILPPSPPTTTCGVFIHCSKI